MGSIIDRVPELLVFVRAFSPKAGPSRKARLDRFEASEPSASSLLHQRERFLVRIQSTGIARGQAVSVNVRCLEQILRMIQGQTVTRRDRPISMRRNGPNLYPHVRLLFRSTDRLFAAAVMDACNLSAEALCRSGGPK